MCMFPPVPCSGMKIRIKMCSDNCRWISSSDFVPSQVSLWLFLFFQVGCELSDIFLLLDSNI